MFPVAAAYNYILLWHFSLLVLTRSELFERWNVNSQLETSCCLFFLYSEHLQVAVDMTTEGVEDTTVVTAMALAVEQGLVLAVKTTACF